MRARDASALLAKYDRPVPRYTSYPPANLFHAGVGACQFVERLHARGAGDRICLYIHVPFCERRCTYCGCHVVPTPKRAIAGKYLEYLKQEMRLLRGVWSDRGSVAVVHLGGGTPTYLTPIELEELLAAVRAEFRVEEGAEVSVELDPRVTTAEHLDSLLAFGTNRISLGVQDTSEEVQRAIGRFQGREETFRFFALCRAKGFSSINVDLVYGLPHQTRERFHQTLQDVLQLRPERLAVYGYAHLPALRPHQQAIETSALPEPIERIELWALSHEEVTAAGYEHIGLDHFALPGDEISRARARESLGRNFMGYTPHQDVSVLGLGVSAISDLGCGYFQVHKKLAHYFRDLDACRLPIERGLIPTGDDMVRRYVIQEILCSLSVGAERFAARFGIALWEYFAPEAERLKGIESDDLVACSPDGMKVLPGGRLFLRPIAAVFDAYLRSTPKSTPTFSGPV
jgi:oxygen-independent coproporphyrinogen-3 oxidase